MKKRRPSSRSTFESNLKGRTSEEWFRHLLSDPVHTTPWITKVEHSGTVDDRVNGIDYFVHTSTGWKIPVDVKSSYEGMLKHIERHGDQEVCIIIMDDSLSDEKMREKALYFIKIWQENAIRLGIGLQNPS